MLSNFSVLNKSKTLHPDSRVMANCRRVPNGACYLGGIYALLKDWRGNDWQPHLSSHRYSRR